MSEALAPWERDLARLQSMGAGASAGVVGSAPSAPEPESDAPWERDLARLQSMGAPKAAAGMPDIAAAKRQGLMGRTVFSDIHAGKLQVPEIQRGLGLAGRVAVEGTIEGAAGLPALAGDAAYNAGAAGYNAANYVRGAPGRAEYGLPVTRALGQVSSGAADLMQLPTPETDTERMAVAVGKGGVGALSGAGATGLLAKATTAGSTLNSIGRTLSSGPISQVLAGTAASGTGEALRQRGVDPATAGLASMAAGVVAGSALPAGRALRAAGQPFTRKGQQQIIGTTLHQMAADPDAAMTRAANPERLVSPPTLAEASGDVGLYGLQRGVRNLPGDPGNALKMRESVQNTARGEALDALAGTEAQLRAAQTAKRNFADQATGQIFDSVPSPPIGSARPVGLGPVFAELDRLNNSRLGSTDAVQSVIREVRKQLSDPKNRDPGTLYAIRDNIASMMEPPKFGQGAAYTPRGLPVDLSRARRALSPVMDALDNAIETGAPGYQGYMQQMRTLNEPINQMQVLQDIRNRALSVGAADPTTGRPFLALGQMNRAVADNIDSMRENLTPEQISRVNVILRDLNRSEAINARTVKAPQSDTLQNLSVASFLGRLMGAQDSALARSALGRPFAFLMQIPERDLQNLLTQAVLDPELGVRLMQQASRRNLTAASSELARLAAANLQAGTSGARTATEDRR